MRQTSESCCCPVDEKERAFDQISNVIDLYRNKEGSLIQVLHRAQEICGHLPLEVQELIADKMNIPLATVSGVVSFYSFFSTVPKGEHVIRVCMGTACYVRGGKKIVEHLMGHLGVDIGETTKDGKFTLEIARCFGACGLAPAMMVDDAVYKQVNINKVERIFEKYREGGR
ncbi:MAG: NAD(P)H-dependent oxidoreductase subunit E [Synergistaceae bacterium]|jgi:NADP-reducing hydrogenase subunit HndA|nr:NAD(P)H-dependent oxidoreductase subunit E [Synergistaceae bacterium]